MRTKINTKQQITSMLLAGAILVSGSFFLTDNKAQAKANDTEKQVVCDSCEEGKDFIVDVRNVNDLEFTSEKDKQDLAEKDAKAKPIWDEIEKLETEIDQKTSQYWEGSDKLVEEMNSIYDAHPEIWEKLNTEFESDNSEGISQEEYIKKSKALNDAEKKILLEENSRLEEIYLKLEEMTQKSYEATKNEQEKLNKLYEEIDKIYGLCE